MDGNIYEAPLPPLSYETTAIIIENTSIVVTFAFSRKALAGLYNDPRFFSGRSRALERAFFDVPEKKARRAIIEVALMYRALDDASGLSRSLRVFELGIVFSRAGTAKPLTLREMANKIIHAQKIEWAFADPDDPRLICHAYQNDERSDWERAEIRVRCIAQACSWLAVAA
jgi:hypothetical protein